MGDKGDTFRGPRESRGVRRRGEGGPHVAEAIIASVIATYGSLLAQLFGRDFSVRTPPPFILPLYIKA